MSENERITVYYKNKQNQFISLGRYSKNPKFVNHKPKEYNINKGCIAKGWEIGTFFDNEFPDNDKQYINYSSKHYSMTKKEINSLKMKSKLFAILRIDRGNEYIGLIVLESMDKDKLTKEKAIDFLKKIENEICNLLTKIKVNQ
jgi:uncharacterized protein (UPF0128 family)